MTDLSQAYSEAKSLPDEVLARELKSGTGMIPGYILLGEMQERKAIRSSTAANPKPTTMVEDYVGSVQPYVRPRGPSSGIAGLTQAGPRYANGGIVALAGGGSIQDQMWAFYKNKGLADHQVAAIMGNVQAESGFRHAVDTGDGGNAWGLFQWNDRRHKMSSAVPDWKQNPVGQMEFAWQEMQGPENRAFQALRNAPDVASANAAMMGFERPAGFTWNNPQGGHNYAGRLANANKFYQQYTGSTPVEVPSAPIQTAATDPTTGMTSIVPATEVATTSIPVEGAAGGDVLGTMMMMSMLGGMGQQKPTDSVAHQQVRPSAPIDPYEVVAATSMTPDHYRKRRNRAYG